MDRKEIGEIFVRESAPLYRFALRLTRSPQDADESVSRAALRCLEKADQFRGESSARTWIFGVLINVVREMRKEHWREESLDDRPYPADADFDTRGQRRCPQIDFGDNPEQFLVRLENVERIRAEMDRLPALQRAVFHLRFVEEWDSNEICNALGITDTNLRVLLHRARLRLREGLVEHAKGESA